MGSGVDLLKAYKKYGKENFEKTILEFFDNIDDMFKKEAEIVNNDFVLREDTYNKVIGGISPGIIKYTDTYYKHREKSMLFSPSLKNKNSDEYKNWLILYREKAPHLKNKDSEEYKNWYNNRLKSFPKKGEFGFEEWMKSHPQFFCLNSEKYKDWYLKWEEKAPHLKNKDSEEYLSWKEKTKSSIPQLKNKDSDEYKNWYNKTLKKAPWKMDKNSNEYKDWYIKMLSGKHKYKKIWMYNEQLKKSKTINKVDIEDFLLQGWAIGRRFYKQEI
jgi:hypothetical protein